MAWFGLIISILSGLFFAARLWRFLAGPPEYFGPAPSADQGRESSRYIVDHLIRYPSQLLAREYPEEAKAAEAHREYEQINRMFEEGTISAPTYAELLELIAAKIDIKEDIIP